VSVRRGVLVLRVAIAAIASSPASVLGTAPARAAGGCAGHLLERVGGGTLTE
jgi:hypothetical protein